MVDSCPHHQKQVRELVIMVTLLEAEKPHRQHVNVMDHESQLGVAGMLSVFSTSF